MKCDGCKENIPEGEDRELHGQTLCEDCCMEALSPAKACDPWAVYSARTFSDNDKYPVALTETQSKILQVLTETGGAEPGEIARRLRIGPADLERDFSTLRHMEKVRAELRQGRKFLRLW